MVPCRWGWYDGILLHTILYRRQVHLHLAKGRLRLGRRHSIFVPLSVGETGPLKLIVKIGHEWVTLEQKTDSISNHERDFDFANPLRSAPLPACLLASFPLTRRSNKTTLHSGHEQSSIAQARHSHQQPVLFCSVLFCSVPFRSVSFRRVRVDVNLSYHRSPIAPCIARFHFSSCSHWRIPAQQPAHSPPYSFSKSQGSLPNLAGSRWVDEERGTRNNEVAIPSGRPSCGGWAGSQPFFRSCGGDRDHHEGLYEQAVRQASDAIFKKASRFRGAFILLAHGCGWFVLYIL